MRDDRIVAADLFCGAGGTSIGAESTGACRLAFGLDAWQIAIDTHSENFPCARHVCARIEDVSPSECSRIDILFASPPCTHHSIARGGRPTTDEHRDDADCLLPWIDYHRPEWIAVENVKEFRDWGPVTRGRPDPKHKGRFFGNWLRDIGSMGYSITHGILNAADFGAATSRERLFIIARKGTKRPQLPAPTHRRTVGGELPGLGLPRWRAAAEIIDWSIPCPSIFVRNRPLADKTLARIEAGLKRFVGPFVAQWDQQSGGGGYRSVTDPVGTLVTKANMGLAIPFMVPFFGEASGQTPRSHDLGEPLPCVTSHGAGGLVVPYVMPPDGFYDSHTLKRCRNSDEPLSTITAGRGGGYVVAPFVIGQQTRSAAREVDRPIPTIATAGAIRLAVPFFSTFYGNGSCTRVDRPLPTLTTKDRVGLSLCSLCGLPPCIANPTSAMRSLLATMRELGVADIGFRMLSNHELSAAQGFHSGYIFCGNKAQITRQIGNSVSPNVAAAITQALAG